MNGNERERRTALLSVLEGHIHKIEFVSGLDMYRANFRSVFIGIETPRLESLKETKKFQNIRGDSLECKLARIQDAGGTIAARSSMAARADDEPPGPLL